MTSLGVAYAAELEQLGLLVDRLPLGVIVFTKKGQDVLYANVAAQRLVHPTNLRKGDPLPDVWPDFSLATYAERLVERGAAGEEQVQAGDRAYLVNGMTARSAETAVLLLEDVSQRERRSRAEREFVANAAHELLTPLTGIVSAAHVLQAGAKEVPEDRDRFIEHIEEECARLAAVARALLVLARAQSGEQPPRLEIVPLCELLDELTAWAGDVPVTVRCSPEITVFVDVDLFAQAATNLFRNAVKHGSGGEIVIDVELLGGIVRIDIVDAGSGMRDDIERFRERFHTGGGRDGGGFGLGLSIAGQSLEAMGGRLVLDVGGAVVTRMELPSGEAER